MILIKAYASDYFPLFTGECSHVLLDQLLVRLLDLFEIHLLHFSIVRHESIDLDLHIRGLGIDCCRETGIDPWF